MKNAWRLILVAMVLSLLTQVLKRLLLDRFGIPNVFSPGRDMLIFCVFAYLLFASDLLRDRLFVLAANLMSLVLVAYLFVAAFDGRLFQGLYYFRIFVIPILFGLSLMAFVDRLSRAELRQGWKFFLISNFLLLTAASSTYIVSMFVPSFAATMMGRDSLDGLQYAWYIAGANILRMGMPFPSPNSLGVYLSMTMMVILAKVAIDLKFSGKTSKIYFVLLALNFGALAMTFSRSAVLLFLVGSLFIIFNPYTATAKMMRVGVLTIVSCIVLSIPILMLVDSMNDGVLHKWVMLNLSGTDPSMQGHHLSIVEAFEKIDEYYLLGYPKGTVGPKAMLFTANYQNVESAIFGIFYDMGLPMGLLFFAGYAMILKRLYVNAFQIGLLVGFGLVLQLLPYFYEYEIIVYFIFCFALIGFLYKQKLADVQNLEKPA